MTQYGYFGSKIGKTNHFKKETNQKQLISAKQFGIAILLSWLILNSFGLQSQTWPPAGMNGSGTSSSPWEITTATHLEALALYVNGGNGDATNGMHYKLINNIDLSSYENWMPIGEFVNYSDFTKAFQGNFNGNSKIIRNLTINRPSEEFVGFFRVAKDAIIENIGIENCNMSGYGDIGGLMGLSVGNFITSCYTSGTIYATRSSAAGLIAESENSNIASCFSTCDVSGGYNRGGLLGNVDRSIISNCYSTGDVTHSGDGGEAVGGLVGCCMESTISNCYATGNVYGEEEWGIGGLVGYLVTNSTIINSYATGHVVGFGMVGGLVGGTWDYDVLISNCYATGSVIGAENVGGLVGKSERVNQSCVIRNCIAANSSINSNTNTTYINRIAGSFDGTLQNNYALNTMTIENNGSPVTITDGLNTTAGMRKDMATLQSLNFYSHVDNWHNTAWDILSSTSVWSICDIETLPWLRWQEIDCNNVNVQEMIKTDKLIVYPNPTSDKFVIEVEGIALIKLYDMLGKEILNQNANGKTEISISHLPKGIYYINITSDRHLIGNRKIVKQ